MRCSVLALKLKQFFDIVISFKMVAFIDFEVVTSSNFEIPNQKSYTFLLAIML